MSIEVRVNVRPTSKQMRAAILRGVATAIIEETKRAYIARANGVEYEAADPWPAISDQWKARKLSEGRSQLIGIYTTELIDEVMTLAHDPSSNQITIKLNTEWAGYFDNNRPVLYVPSTDVINEYVAASVQEAISGN